ncbi:hypothetical protein PBI_NESBITT_36 [Streptomyces phage Nesbitt]|uniref:Uncharacterized protein n=1 Tax=Streptomyces phage Nesbitt TaxID=2108133 RepID=A0A2P1JT34_9CAUD|nr:hypothetical protein PBI_NESBITT_36 [Streptomyces phage Nesbitt]
MGEQTFKAGAEVTVDRDPEVLTVDSGPFKARFFDGGFYVIKRADGSHRWVFAGRLKAHNPKPEGYRKRDRVKVGSTGILGLGELVDGPFRMGAAYDKRDGWLVRLDDDGTHVLAPERMLYVTERPTGSPTGNVTIKGVLYPVGERYRYRDRDGDVWNTRSVGGLARACLTSDGTPSRNSFTLAHVVNAHGPLTRV